MSVAGESQNGIFARKGFALPHRVTKEFDWVGTLIATYPRRIWMNRVARIALGISLALLLGWNSAFLQGVAWCSMVVSYGQQAPLKTAVQWTFDGKHRCELCRLAQQTANDEKKPRATQPSVRLEAVIPSSQVVVIASIESDSAFFASIAVPPSRSLRPVYPPPRLG